MDCPRIDNRTAAPAAAPDRPADRPWLIHMAMASTVMAALAGVGTLLATHASNLDRVDGTRAVLLETRIEAVRTQRELLATKMQLLTTDGVPASKLDRRRLAALETEQAALQSQWQAHAPLLERHLRAADVAILGVAGLQLAIVLNGLASLLRHRALWIASLSAAGAGTLLMGLGAGLL